MSQWYYSKGGQQQGMVSSEQLKQLATTGQLQPDDLVWKEGMGQWAEARKVKGLFPTQTAENPTSPAPTAAASVPSDLPVHNPEVPSDKPEDWFYARDNQQFGPVSFQKLFELAASGELRPYDAVARNGAKWCIAGQLLLAFTPQIQVPQLINADQWFYRTQGGEHGPVTFQELVAAALNGTLRPTDFIGRPGTNWVPAGAVIAQFPQGAQTLTASQNVGVNPGTTTVMRSPFIGMATGFVIALFLGGFFGMMFLGAAIGCGASIFLARKGLLRYLPMNGAVTVAGCVAASLLGLFCFGVVGDSAMSQSQMETFLDTPLSYKGKTLTMELAFGGEPLSSWVENGVIATDVSVPFHLIGRLGHNIHATIPAGMKVPSLVSGDFVRVTFICKEGSSGSGNIITKLARQ